MSIFLRYYLPVLLWAALILLLSGSEFAGSATYKWLRSVAEFFTGPLSSATASTLNAVARKLAHVTEYFILGLLLWRAWRAGARPSWRSRWAVGTLGLGVAWAAGDETYQTFQASRVGSVLDVGYDTLGLLLALALVYWHARRKGTAFRRPETSGRRP